MKIDKQEFLDIVKKNILSIISGAIVLIALIALYWPINSPMYSDTQATLNKRKVENDALQRLRTTPRSWPAIPDPANPNPIKLTLFPNRERIDKGNEIKDAIHEQAQKIKTETAKNNAHEQLAEGVLPQPGEKRFLFATAYQEMMLKTLPADLKSTMPPTDVEIHDAADLLWNNNYVNRIVKVSGKAVNQDAIVGDWREAAAKLPESMRLQRASDARIYISPDAIALSRTILNSPSGPRESEIWYAQNMLWVEQDVIAAINRMNADSKSVMESPIKHLIQLHVADDQNQYVRPATGGMPGGGMSGQGGQAADGGGFARSVTGRMSNPTYDVIDFTLTINVDASKIPAILAELERGKLITVQQVNASAVDGAAAAESGLIYGDVPVAHLVIHGEDVFMREWTTPWMPDPVKATLGITVAAGPAGMPPH